MKVIAYTQRVSILEDYNERRDCADQMIPNLLQYCGYIPIPIPNVPKLVESIMTEIRPKGFFFSGGNSLVKYDGDAPERDETEKILTDWAIKNDLPVFGICRGMQFLADYFGANLSKIENHVRIRHKIHGIINREAVNSYHSFGLFNVPDILKALAYAEDNSIEAFKHNTFKIIAVAWHPERESIFSNEDVKLIKDFFK